MLFGDVRCEQVGRLGMRAAATLFCFSTVLRGIIQRSILELLRLRSLVILGVVRLLVCCSEYAPVSVAILLRTLVRSCFSLGTCGIFNYCFVLRHSTLGSIVGAFRWSAWVAAIRSVRGRDGVIALLSSVSIRFC